ncbi:Bro1 protein [Pichia kluyveri]|uniref:BRO domain-containing protein 1 n=1 Tax=Pichia kluyveri TaxID=36015 RepID=A0AAV5R0F3_PICKL|nr:Bro1 protein [Pichia kluyveri]
MSTFVYLPLKKTTDIDWESSLNTFLTSTFGRSFTSEISPSIKTLNKLRLDIQHSSIKDSDVSLSIYADYISQLNSLGLRLPMDIMLRSSKLEFSWSEIDSSSDGEYFQQKSISYEKACILFNFAASYLYLGIDSSSRIDWKSSVSFFTKAAGIFEFISTHFLHAPTEDLKVENIKGLYKLSLAQAYECFFWNYMQTSETTKHSLAARLSEGISVILKQANTYFDKTSINLGFNDLIEFKINYFHSLALYHYAQNYAELNKIGFGLRVLKSTKIYIAKCIGLKNKSNKKTVLEPTFIQLAIELEKDILAKEKEWEKDNELIYNQVLPPSTDVPTIKAMNPCKPVDFEKHLKEFGCKDLFFKIIPMEAHKGMSIYSEKQAEILRLYSEKVLIANQEIKSVFEFSKLPSSLVEIENLFRDSNPVLKEEDREKEVEYPRVLAMAHEVESSKTVDFKFYLTENNNKKEQITKSFSKADELLLQDEKNMLVKGLPESTELYSLKEKITKLRRSLMEASISDSKLESLLKQYEEEIGVLRGGTESVQKWLDKSDKESTLVQQVSLLDLDDNDSKSSEFDKKTAEQLIKTIYSKKKSLELLIDERDSTLEDLKQIMHNEDISSVLIKYNNASEGELDILFKEELEKYSNYTGRVDALISAQDGMIIDLKDSLRHLLDLDVIKKRTEEKKKERNTIRSRLSRLINAYDAWKLCAKGIPESNSFYSAFTEQTMKLVNQIHDIVNQRDLNVSRNSSISSSYTGNLGFGGYTRNNIAPPPPSYDTSTNSGVPPIVPALPSKPTNTGSGQPYTTPSVYDPSMYSQFGKDWK